MQTREAFNKIFIFVILNKAHGPDGILGKLVKTSADLIDCHLASIIKNFLK